MAEITCQITSEYLLHIDLKWYGIIPVYEAYVSYVKCFSWNIFDAEMPKYFLSFKTQATIGVKKGINNS